MSSRNKGKRWERFFAEQLKDIFPDVQRNYNAQSANGGRDLLNTGPFAVECKGGKSYKYAGIRKILDQCHDQAAPEELELSLVKPTYEDPYILMPFADFLELLERMKEQDLL